MGKGNDIWNDPEWDALKRRHGSRTATSSQKTPTNSHKQEKPAKEAVKVSKDQENINVSVNLSVPKIKLPKIPRPNLSRKQVKIGAACAGIIGVSIFASVLIINRNKGDSSDVLGDNSNQPDFDTVLPEGKTENTTSSKLGWDPQRRVASFTDTIGTANITVSEQPLPEAFKENTDEQVKKMAENFAANTVINESNPKAYLGTSVKGPQTVIFHKNGVLVFIQSNKTVEKDQWAQYITKLL